MTKGSILHERYETGGAAAARRPEFAGVNTVLSNLKTALSGQVPRVRLSQYAHRSYEELACGVKLSVGDKESRSYGSLDLPVCWTDLVRLFLDLGLFQVGRQAKGESRCQDTH
jgi:hypothetical protein